jgi:hypothetical protein
MRIIKKYKKKIILLVFMCLMCIVQAKAQFFEDDDGPGDFDPPPDNDVPLDTYQWIMLFLALAYGAFIFWKHYQKNKQARAGESFRTSLPESGPEHCI